MTIPTDDLPTEAIPVVPEVVDDQRVEYRDEYRDDSGDDLFDDEFDQPRSRSRMTVALVALLLVAIGFLAGVLVGRDSSASNVPQRGAGTAATSTARPGGGAGAFGRIGRTN